ncbi:LysR family transcriptional regulator [Rhodoplanes azumiensis]|uniref:LysR family transcriptional regulator n=1 Tax=Rhodoplanes azumiensis TaxID=1897628 RepID=A0ABW5AHV3_9BRAD
MDLKSVRCFVEVAENLHFGRAAERLRLAQSVVSRQIAGLEAELGVRLIERHKRAPIRLTPAGALFLDEARAALAQFERAELVVRQAERGERGRLEIGYVASATWSGLLPSAVFDFRRARPGVTVSLTEMESWRQLEALAEGRIDVGFLRPRPDYPASLAVLPQLREPVLVALRADHPLAALHGAIPAARLAGEAFAVPQADERGGFVGHTLAIGKAGGFSPRIAHHVRDFISVLNLVGVGLAVAAVPSSLQRLRLPDVVYRPLADCEVFAELAAASRRSGNAAVVRSFVRVLKARGETVLPVSLD